MVSLHSVTLPCYSLSNTHTHRSLSLSLSSLSLLQDERKYSKSIKLGDELGKNPTALQVFAKTIASY